jgi:hypothetical protein
MSSSPIPFIGKDECTWRKDNAAIFRSDPSARWFFREHRDELVEAGVVAFIGGRWIVTDPARMTQVVIEIGCADALRIVQKSTATPA